MKGNVSRVCLRVLAALAFILVLVLGTWSLHAGSDAVITGVRSTSPIIREMIDDAAWESRTFRDIVQAIRASDGIVYVEEGVCRHGVHACLLLDLTPAAGFRIPRILVDLQGVIAHRKRLDVLATIGHELWHALEVLTQPSLRTTSEVFLFYDRQFPTSDSAFETAAAIAAGTKIRRELGNHTTLVWQQVALDLR